MAKVIPFPQSGSHERRTGGRFPGLFGYDLGLNDEQIAALISADQQKRKAIFDIDPQLGGGDRQAIPILRWAVALLSAVADCEPLKSTAGGNLPQKLVRQLFAGDFRDAEPDFVRVNREDHSPVLSRTRQLCRKGGMLVYRNQEFRLNKAARQALESEDWSFVYRKLLEAHLSRPQMLDEYDRLDDFGALAAALPLLLFACRDSNEALFYEESFAWLIQAVGLTPGIHWLDHARVVGLRFFQRFAEPFGLFEPGPEFVPPWELPTRWFSHFGRARRRTELFDRLFRWHVDPPARAYISDRAAAAEIMNVVHEVNQAHISYSEDSWTEAMCVRAIERCPADADAYVVLANLYEQRPRQALQFVEAGLEATADQVPEVPDGYSAWDDRGFRDVLRLHFIRAEVLHALGRLAEACEQYERLFQIDPPDGIGARDHYVAVLLEAGAYERAHQIDESAGDYLPFAAPYWNAALTAFARKDRARARAKLAQALQINANVPEMIFNRWLPDPPPHYSPGDRNEAIIYAHSARKAWRTVPGALAWLRKAAP